MSYESQVKTIKDRINRASKDNSIMGIQKLSAAQNELLVLQNDEIIRLLTIIANKN